MIGKMEAVIMRVAIKSHFPQSCPRKAYDVAIAAVVFHIDHHNNAIGRTLLVPAMECEDFGAIVKMVNMDILTAQSPRHAMQIAP